MPMIHMIQLSNMLKANAWLTTYQDAYKVHSNIILAFTGYISYGNPTATQVDVQDFATVFARWLRNDLPNIKAQIQ